MATQVLGEDGREIAEKLGDLDALDLARNVHAATGEVVKLVPYVLKKGKYVLDEAGARVFGASQAAADPEEPKALSDLTVKELKALAAEKDVKVPANAKKADLVAALGA